ncbi:hypothetical protein BDR06DRAFT_985029 [Suillus hirtellus]|nr:hypothetical protein BDR06DRAFT_985029 [Suillus hirtellus]
MPSQLCPNCLAHDKLKLWFLFETRTAIGADGQFLTILDEDLERVLLVMNLSWAPRMRECYGAGLLVFYVFYSQRCPVDTHTMLNFIASCAGTYSGKTLTNYVYEVKAWHTLHGQLWEVQQNELKASLDGVSELAPESSKHTKHAAVFVCLTSTFNALCQIRELTVRTMKTFDPTKHIKCSDLQMDVEDRHRLRVTKIFLPCTKAALTEEGIYWAQQQDASDPKVAIPNHFLKGVRPLTRSEFWKRISGIIKKAELGNLKGYGLHIRGTLDKLMGRWLSKAFTIYLCKHALILAPYLQESQALELFTRYTMLLMH